MTTRGAEVLDWARWTGRKLASQDLGYSIRRVRYAARRRVVDRQFPTQRMLRRATFALAPGMTVRQELLERSSPKWHFSDATRAEIASQVPSMLRSSAVAGADEIVERRFTYRGIGPIELQPMRWDIAPGGLEDWTWDLNRHRSFATLGFAYQYTNDRRYLQAFRELAGDWSRRCLPRLGELSWDAPFEVAARINSWLWALFLFLSADEWPDDEVASFVESIGVMAEYLFQTIEFHSPGNHILLEAKALALCSEVLPRFRGSQSWRKRGWEIVLSELDRQICADGVHAERSTMYHRIVAGELCELWLFAHTNGMVESERLHDCIERMADFEAWLDLGDRRYPVFGDGYETDSYLRFDASHVTRVLNGTDDQGEATTDFEAWATATHANVNAVGTVSSLPERSRAFFEGGYFVSRSGTASRPSVLVWDCGPAGYMRNRKHAHLDTLSFVLSIDGHQILIDPGTDESSNRAHGLRGTRAHNTVEVDEEDQGLLAHRGEIWSPPHATLELWATDGDIDVMEGSHDGYRRLEDPVTHVRTLVLWRDEFWLVVDHISGTERHRSDQRFHFSPLITIEDVGDRSARAIVGDLRIPFAFAATGPLVETVLTITDGVAELEYGERLAIPVLNHCTFGQTPFAQVAAVAPRGHLEVAIDRTTPEATVLRLTTDRADYEIDVAHGPVGPRSSVGGLSTEARVVLAMSDGHGRQRLIAVGARAPRDEPSRGNASDDAAPEYIDGARMPSARVEHP